MNADHRFAVRLLHPIVSFFAVLCLDATLARAATITVTSIADGGAGTLRAALANAADGDTINFALRTPTFITLVGGELVISKSVRINGPGANSLAVNGNAASRVLRVAPSNVVTISGLTISNGFASTQFANLGGGILNSQSSLLLSNCVVAGNYADFSGGGVYNDGARGSASLQIVNSTVRGNTAGLGSGSGGGIYNDGEAGLATVKIANSTLSGNHAFNVAAGILNNGVLGDAHLQIVGSTLSSNIAQGRSGAILNTAESGNASVLILNSTLSGNSANQAASIYNEGFGGTATVEIGSTILGAAGTNVFGNASITNIFNQAGTITSLGFNISSDDGSGSLTNTTDQIVTDPMLGPLQNNGGPTSTHALLSCSPAIDRGTNFIGSSTDQRGVGLVRTFDDPATANATGSDGSDIGAFEAQVSLTDTNPPVIICPTNQVFPATSTNGATVNYQMPSATDNCPGVTLVCSPPTNSIFAIGTTTVNCIATDNSGNQSSCTFTVRVKGAPEQIDDVAAAVQSFGLKRTLTQGFVVKLQRAGNLIRKERPRSACMRLQSFIRLVDVRTRRKQITSEQSAQLLSDGGRIRAVVDCH